MVPLEDFLLAFAPDRKFSCSVYLHKSFVLDSLRHWSHWRSCTGIKILKRDCEITASSRRRFKFITHLSKWIFQTTSMNYNFSNPSATRVEYCHEYCVNMSCQLISLWSINWLPVHRASTTTRCRTKWNALKTKHNGFTTKLDALKLKLSALTRNAMHSQRIDNALPRISVEKCVCVDFSYAGFSQIGSHITKRSMGLCRPY